MYKKTLVTLIIITCNQYHIILSQNNKKLFIISCVRCANKIRSSKTDLKLKPSFTLSVYLTIFISYSAQKFSNDITFNRIKQQQHNLNVSRLHKNNIINRHN